jgi:ketosteroid isomerase-like protein
MTPADAARRWAATWQRAWEALDVDAIAALYHPDAVFSSQPFRSVYRGRGGVRAYVSGAFAEERDVRAWFGTPIVDGKRAAVEWWAALVDEGREVTLAGTSVLRFDAQGLVLHQRDTWNVREGRADPPEDWGS